jgi:RecA/RadA recombinase
MPSIYPLSWGVEELDRLTGAGIISRCLYLLYGETGVGKTTLSTYHPICRSALKLKETLGEIPEKVRWIVMDGDGGFDLDRLRQIVEANGLDWGEIEGKLLYTVFTTFSDQHNFICGKKKKKKEAEEELETPEEEVPVSEVAVPREATRFLEEVINANGLENWLATNPEIVPLTISVDPIVAIYRGILLRTPLDARAVQLMMMQGKMDLQLAVLRKLSVVYDIPVFVTTWSRSPLGKAFKEHERKKAEKEAKKSGVELELPETPDQPFIGGRTFGFIAKQIWEITAPSEYQPVRVAKVWKSRTVAQGRYARFRLCDAGIEPVK